MDYNNITSDSIIERMVVALKARNINTIVVDTKEEALIEIKKLIPTGGSVMNGSSATLQEIGFIDYLKSGEHSWKNVHEDILSEKDENKKARLRKEAVLVDYFLGSVHAVTESGQVIIASGSGSQIASYVYTSNNIIWVVGAQKIVPNLEVAFDRINKYVIPLEDARMKNAGYAGSTLGKILIFEREIMPNRHITMILVKEKLGF